MFCLLAKLRSLLHAMYSEWSSRSRLLKSKSNGLARSSFELGLLIKGAAVNSMSLKMK